MSGREGETAGEAASGGWRAAPRLDALDLVALVWRERWAAIAVGAGVVLIGLFVALQRPTLFNAESRILVRLGQEYVFSPAVGGAGAGAAPKTEEVLNAEVRLITSPEIVRLALGKVGYERVFPDLFKDRPTSDPKARAQAELAFTRRLSVDTAPQTPIIALAFRNENAQIAAETLNAYVDAYLDYRGAVLLDRASQVYDQQSEEYQRRLDEAADALTTFLAANGIGDFPTDLKSLADTRAKIEADLVTVRAERQASQAQAATLRARLQAEPETIDLFTESDAARRLVELQGERAQLLAQYAPTAPPVVAIERRIAEFEGFLDGGPRPALTRRGPNPVRQEIATRLIETEAAARAAMQREAALAEQAQRTGERLRVLQSLESQYLALVRERAVLEQNAQSLAARAEESRALQAIAGRADANIAVIERATPPARGRSGRLLVLLAAVFVGGVLGLGVALARGFFRGGFPTLRSVERSLGVPVVAALGAPKDGAPP